MTEKGPLSAVAKPIEWGDRFLQWAYGPGESDLSLTDLIAPRKHPPLAGDEFSLAHEAKHLAIGFFVPFHSTLRHTYGDLRRREMDWTVVAFDVAFAPSTIAFTIGLLRLAGAAIPQLRVAMFVASGVGAILRPIAAAGARTLARHALARRLVQGTTRQVTDMTLIPTLSAGIGRVESLIATPRDVLLPWVAFGDAWINEKEGQGKWINLLFGMMGLRNYWRRAQIKREAFAIAGEIHPDHFDRHYRRALSPEARPLPRGVPTSEAYVPQVTTFETTARPTLSWGANLRQQRATFFLAYFAQHIHDIPGLILRRLRRRPPMTPVDYTPLLQLYGGMAQRANQAAFRFDGIQRVLSLPWDKNPLVLYASHHGQGLWEIFGQQHLIGSYIRWLTRHAETLARAQSGHGIAPDIFRRLVENHPTVVALNRVARAGEVSPEFVAGQLKRLSGDRGVRAGYRRLFEIERARAARATRSDRSQARLLKYGIPDDPEHLLGLIRNHEDAVALLRRAQALRMEVTSLGGKINAAIGHPRMDADDVNFRDSFPVWLIRFGRVLDKIGIFWTHRSAKSIVQAVNRKLRRYQRRSFFTKKQPPWRRILIRVGWYVRTPRISPQEKARDIIAGRQSYLIYPEGGRNNLSVDLRGNPVPALHATKRAEQTLENGTKVLRPEWGLAPGIGRTAVFAAAEQAGKRPVFVMPLGYDGMVSANLSKNSPFFQPNLTGQRPVVRFAEGVEITAPKGTNETIIGNAARAVNRAIDRGLREAGRFEERVRNEVLTEWFREISSVGGSGQREVQGGMDRIARHLADLPALDYLHDLYIIAARIRLLRPSHQREVIPQFFMIASEAGRGRGTVSAELLGRIETFHREVYSKIPKRTRFRQGRIEWLG